MKHRRLLTTLTVALPLVLLASSPAAADGPWVHDGDYPIYTWRDAQSTSSTIYNEPTAGSVFFRKGVRAFIDQASGYTWQTTVWLGTVSTSGTNEAGIIDSQLNSARTKARCIFLPNPNNTNTLRFIAWLTNVVSSMKVVAGAPIPEGIARAETVSTGEGVIPGFGSVSDQVPTAVVSTFRDLGGFKGYEAWRVTDAASTVHLLVSDGRYLSESTATADEFAASGLPIRIDTPKGAVQLALLPSDSLNTSGLLASGFTAVSPELYATANPADSYSVVHVPTSAAAATQTVARPNTAASGGADVIVPLLVPPTE